MHHTVGVRVEVQERIAQWGFEILGFNLVFFFNSARLNEKEKTDHARTTSTSKKTPSKCLLCPFQLF